MVIVLNWWKGKPSGSIAYTRKQQPRFYWSCSSVVMNNATPMTPLAHAQNSIFKCKQHTCTLHGPWGPEKIWLHHTINILSFMFKYQQCRSAFICSSPTMSHWLYKSLLFNINGRAVQRKNVVNNVDKSSLWAPWQNGSYKNTQNITKHGVYKDTTDIKK